MPSDVRAIRDGQRPGPGQSSLRAIAVPLIAAALVTLVFGMLFATGWGGRTVVRYADDLGCAAAAAIAGLLSIRAARRISPQFRGSWTLIAIGVFAWLAGDLLWVTFDLSSGKTPGLGLIAGAFPFLPAFAAAALLRLPGKGADGGKPNRLRWIFDGSLIALSGFFLAWTTMLGGLVADRHVHAGALLVATAFPLADVAVLTAVILAGVYAPVATLRLRVLTVAMGWLAVADSSYAYLAATNQYRPGAFCDLAYIAAFATLAAVSVMPDGPAHPRQTAPGPASGWRAVLPYIPLGIAAAVALIRRIMGHQLGVVGLALWTAITALVLLRQYLTLLDNRRLLRKVEEQAQRLSGYAFTDPVTGLGNRLLFTERVSHALALHARDRRAVTLCWVDVDDFKVINDTYGHATGDELLVALAGRLSGALRAGDTVARLGGDEFGVLLEDGADGPAVAAKLHAATQEPFLVADSRIRVPASIGLATLAPDEPPVNAEELMSRADVAMYAAKGRGKNRIEAYQPGMTMPGTDEVALRDVLRDDIAAGAIDVHFQPVLRTGSGRLRGFEALARWAPNGTPVSPDRFVVLAERLGLARDLGELILDRSVAQLALWSRMRGDDRLQMSVNLSPEQLLDPQLPARVAAILHRNAVPAHQLTLEITERALLTDDPNAVRVAKGLTRLGVNLALDDFGTGYSSLAHLRGFPLGAFKLDRSFVADIDTDAQAHDFLRALIRLGRDLGLRLVAEGVERPSQLAVLRELGCDFIQGYLISAPEPAGAFDIRILDLEWGCPSAPAAAADAQAVPPPRSEHAFAADTDPAPSA